METLPPHDRQVAKERMDSASKKFEGFRYNPKAQEDAYKSYVDMYSGFIKAKDYQISLPKFEGDNKDFQDSLIIHKGLGEEDGRTMRGWAKKFFEEIGFSADDPKTQAQRNLLINRLLQEIASKGVNVHHKIANLEAYKLTKDVKTNHIMLEFLGAQNSAGQQESVLESIDLDQMIRGLDSALLSEKADVDAVSTKPKTSSPKPKVSRTGKPIAEAEKLDEVGIHKEIQIRFRRKDFEDDNKSFDVIDAVIIDGNVYEMPKESNLLKKAPGEKAYIMLDPMNGEKWRFSLLDEQTKLATPNNPYGTVMADLIIAE